MNNANLVKRNWRRKIFVFPPGTGWGLFFGTRAYWKQGACLCAPAPRQPALQESPFLVPTSPYVCARHVNASPPHPPGSFERQLGPSGPALRRWPGGPGNNGLSLPNNGLSHPLRTGFARERATYLTYWLRGSHWLCHPGKSADGNRCPLCSRGCQSGAPRGSTGNCSAPSHFLDCPEKS